MEPLARALESARTSGRAITVPYVMVERRRTRGLRPLLASLRTAGATAVELGFPFSDPIADGPVLEAAADAALREGTRWTDLLEQVRLASQELPTAVMTYANPVWAHGLRDGVAAVARAGATGLIVPDLSLEESGPWRRATEEVGVSLVLLAAPAASAERVARIARRSRGFLYMVSRYGTTGAGAAPEQAHVRALVRAAHRAHPELPVLLGFGVRDAPTARSARSTGADGVIVGSALEERLAAGASRASTARWFRSIAGATVRR